MDELGLTSYYEDSTIDMIDAIEDTPISIETYHNGIDIYKNYSVIKKSNRTKPIMTKYEKTKMLGIRAEMLAGGAKPLVTVPKNMTKTIDIAILELNEMKLPFIIKRKVTGGYDYWKVNDLKIPNN